MCLIIKVMSICSIPKKNIVSEISYGLWGIWIPAAIRIAGMTYRVGIERFLHERLLFPYSLAPSTLTNG